MKNFLLTIVLMIWAVQPAAADTKAGFCAATADMIVSLYEGRQLGISAARTSHELGKGLSQDKMEVLQILIDIAYTFPFSTNPVVVWEVSYAACMSESM